MQVQGERKFTLRTYLLLDPAGRVFSFEEDFELRVAPAPYDKEVRPTNGVQGARHHRPFSHSQGKVVGLLYERTSAPT